MEFVRKHKFTVFTIVMLLVMVILAVSLVRFLIPDSNGDEYGNRLKGIEDYPIDEAKIDELKEEIGQNDAVTSVDYILEGRLIDITISVKDETERDVVKGYADQLLTYFTDEQKSYYDIQVLIKSDNEESEKYPIMGYRHKSNAGFVWSNN